MVPRKRAAWCGHVMKVAACAWVSVQVSAGDVVVFMGSFGRGVISGKRRVNVQACF